MEIQVEQNMEYFVEPKSIVRRIWGNGDTILFIFAGASAEFALNKAVDWLYFTGRLPADPLGRLFSTVMYARGIVFSEKEKALQVIDKISSIHTAVEEKRQSTIPDWAYRDVLYMLIHYSISSFELLQRKLTDAEKDDVFDVFYRMGTRMNLKDLPHSYKDWKISQEYHLKNDLINSKYTVDLYKQYRKHLGPLRFYLLRESQKMVCPLIVLDLLHMKKVSIIAPVLSMYKLSRKIKLDRFLRSLVMPAKYKKQIEELG